ncbi:MAG: GNAT family acetyltransferase [Gammaproteobacteria bacterium]|nr:GNAT family acetyltransferase [Gammaproteobacteria bacterium]
MHIRPYAQNDEDAVVALWERCGLLRPWNDPRRDIARKCAFQGDLFWVGIENDALVATVMAGYEGHRGWVNYLAVDPRCQHQGKGKRMMAFAERRLRELGCPKLNLQVRSSNGAVIAFYRALGFEQDEVVSLGKRLIADD